MSRFRRILLALVLTGALAAYAVPPATAEVPDVGRNKGLSICVYALVAGEVREQCTPLPRIYLPIPLPF